MKPGLPIFILFGCMFLNGCGLSDSQKATGGEEDWEVMPVGYTHEPVMQTAEDTLSPLEETELFGRNLLEERLLELQQQLEEQQLNLNSLVATNSKALQLASIQNEFIGRIDKLSEEVQELKTQIREIEYNMK